jgi:phosphoribosylformylglycinamidine synthase
MANLHNDKNILFIANVSIENKSYLNDPEGDTIFNDLILKEGYHDIVSVRTAKTLIIELFAKNIEDAQKKIKEMCDGLRIYNPIVSECRIVIQKKEKIN